MPDIELPQLPFLTREMLTYGKSTSLRLRLSAASNIAGTVTLRAITRSGVFDLTVTTTADGVLNTAFQNIDDFPILVSITDGGGAFLPGQCWVSAELEITNQETIALCSGFVYVSKGVTYPAITQTDIIPNRGHFMSVASANPAAGAEATLTVPAGEVWKVLGADITLVTDATVANRRVHFLFTRADGFVWRVFDGLEQSASITNRIKAMLGMTRPTGANNSQIYSELAGEIWLDPGGTITTVTTNLQAADDLGVMTVFVEKFFGFA